MRVDDLILAGQQDPVWWIENILGVTLWDKQKDICYSVRDNKYTCVQSGHNTGKLLDVATQIPAPGGMRTMGDLRVGDLVYDETGAETRVTWVSPVETKERSFELTFSDGTRIKAGASHQWYCESDSERRKRSRSGVKDPGKVRTTLEMFESKHRWSIPLAAGYDGDEAELPVDPYALGYWLGDGAENFERLRALRYFGIELHKPVADKYFWASREQRLDLLQGLLDSGGSVNRGSGAVEYASCLRPLSEAVFRLAASLGLNPRRPKGDRHRVSFFADFPVFSLPDKLALQSLTISPRTKHRMIVSIVEIDPLPMKCISVDSPRRLYLCTDACIPTHNTFSTACLCLWFVSCFPDAVVLTTANGWAQVKGVLWEEIRKLAKRSRYPLGLDFKPKNPEVRCGLDNWMFGFSPDDPDAVQGHHRDNILIVFDEAQGLKDKITWDAFGSMMTSSGARQLVIGNPLYPTGPFRDCFRNPNWSQVKMSCLDHPNYVFKKQIIPGALTYESIEEIRQDPLRGPGTIDWDTRVAGVFPAIGDDTVLPEPYLRRNAALDPSKPLLTDGAWIGFDPAGFGNDRNVAAVLVNGHLEMLDTWRHAKPEVSVARILKLAAKYKVPQEHINYDIIGGVGASIRQAFLRAQCPAHPVAVGQPPVGDWAYFFSEYDATLLFLNRRAELHWAMRRLFESGLIRVPMRYYQQFATESCKLRYGFNQKGMLYIESKNDKFRPREKYSPDHNDALTLALARDQSYRGPIVPTAKTIPADPRTVDPHNKYGSWSKESRSLYGPGDKDHS